MNGVAHGKNQRVHSKQKLTKGSQHRGVIGTILFFNPVIMLTVWKSLRHMRRCPITIWLGVFTKPRRRGTSLTHMSLNRGFDYPSNQKALYLNTLIQVLFLRRHMVMHHLCVPFKLCSDSFILPAPIWTREQSSRLND